MAFDDELRAHLEGLEAARGEPPRLRMVDSQELRTHFLRRLRSSVEASEIVDLQFTMWSPRIERFAKYIEHLPAQQAPADPVGALRFACAALDVALESDEPISHVDQLELARIVGGFGAFDGGSGLYALENHLVRRENSEHAQLTGLGRVFLKLRGKDAVRWLLTIETSGSRGPVDEWRCSYALLEAALSDSGIEQHEGASLNDWRPFSWMTVNRLVDLGVLSPSRFSTPMLYRYVAHDNMRDVLKIVLDRGPWTSAVAALADDERARAFRSSGPTASDITIDQTRMFAHEVRNALVPARHHVDALLALPPTEWGKERVEAARRGVVRVLAFVDELVATSELVDEPATTLQLKDVVAESIGWIEGGDRVSVDEAVETITLRAPRTRLARALSNLILNAVQATTAPQAIRMSARQTTDRVEIAVDDAGHGVPEADRPRVFDDGFTTRPGGSGFGLAFVRNVVETRFRGTVRCEASDLGGARFVITIPKVPTP